MQNSLSFEMNQTFSIFLDSFAITILLIILFTMLAFKTKMPSLRRLLVLCSIFGIISSATDILYLVVSIQSSMSTLYYELTKINAFSLIMFLLIKSWFTLIYVDEEKRSNMFIKISVTTIAASLFVITLVPSLYSMVNYISEGSRTVLYGSLHSVYVLLLASIEALTFFAIISNFKKMLLKSAIMLALFQSLPIIVFFMSGERIAPALLFMAIFLLVTYIIIFQGEMISKYEQAAMLSKMKLDNKDMGTKLVLSQVQPHFMYNTLSSIAYYCKKDPDLAKKLTLDFSTYLRNNIDSLDGESDINFTQELEHTKTYLDIEQVRFGDRLKVAYDIQFDNFTVPSLILQPIVENAVKHGVCKKEGGGTIIIRTEKKDEAVVITVSDDGVGFNPSEEKNDGKNHIGIKNVRERLETFCGGSLDIESSKKTGTVVTIRIPVEVNL